MNAIAGFIEAAQRRALTVVLPEGRDDRILRAACRLQDEGIARPIVLGKAEQLAAAAQIARMDLARLHTIDPARCPQLDTYAAAYVQKRGLEPAAARRLVQKPTFFGGMMVAAGEADTMVAGVTCPTAIVIQAGTLTVGYAPGIETPSSFFLFVLPELRGKKDQLLIYADCGMNIDPTPAELADIALTSAATAVKLLPEKPRVALLSFSTCGSANHAAVDKMTTALGLARQRAGAVGLDGEFCLDGEFQADAALIPHVAAKKVKRPSAVAGQANVLIFPDLNAGNIAYKLTQYLAGAQAFGPILQGFARPISDLSRGASVDDIVAITAICLALA